ncbi:MAG TPA: sialidase family protein [Candidatus Thermoplasmatota archaeon]|nr:sialidase family protein [Candidatus Thermoplasmatota archaeon]
MRLRAFAPAFALLLAGCVEPPVGSGAGPAAEGALEALAFLEPVVVDAERIASEPSVKVGADGTIFVAAPTGVIKYATRPLDAVQHVDKGIFQGAIWRSADGGASFEHLAGLGPSPYHTAQPGGGDSDIAIDSAGRVYVTDQFGFFTESVQWSDDNGDTWHAARLPASGPPPVDRQWMWPDPDAAGHVYMVHNGDRGIWVTETRDGGDTWSGRVVTEFSTAPGPLVALPGGFVAFSYFDDASGDVVTVRTTDGGKTWIESAVVEGAELNDFFPGTFADAAGTLYVSWVELDGDVTRVAYVVSLDRGETWSAPRVAAEAPGYATFAWGVAGAPGRIAFTWYAAPDPEKEWHLEAVVLLGADGDAPAPYRTRISTTAVRTGPPCQDGSFCRSGRELGDFQSVAVTPDGDLVATYVTVLSAEEGGRVTFARQSLGPRLYDEPPALWVV